MLMFDEFEGHITLNATPVIRTMNAVSDLVIVPGGMTS
jgi:hypothetical protein